MKNHLGVRKPPKRVSFIYPNGRRLKGTVLAEVYEKASYDGGDYLFVVQKIRIDGRASKQYDVRIGYYRKEHAETKWRWGSQTTFQADSRTTTRLLRKAKRSGIFRSDS